MAVKLVQTPFGPALHDEERGIWYSVALRDEESSVAVQTTSNQPVQIRLRPKPAKPSKKGSKK